MAKTRTGTMFIVRDYGDLGKGRVMWAADEGAAAKAWMAHKHPKRKKGDLLHYVEVHDPRTGMFGMWAM